MARVCVSKKDNYFRKLLFQFMEVNDLYWRNFSVHTVLTGLCTGVILQN